MAKVPLIIRNDQELEAALGRAEALFDSPITSERNRELTEIAEAVQVYTDAMRVLRSMPGDGERPRRRRSYYNA